MYQVNKPSSFVAPSIFVSAYDLYNHNVGIKKIGIATNIGIRILVHFPKAKLTYAPGFSVLK
jgi:hypothetical protein